MNDVETGSSKKKAKHCAAQSALNQLIGVQNGQNSEENGYDKPAAACLLSC